MDKTRTKSKFGFQQKMMCNIPRYLHSIIFITSGGFYGNGGKLTLKKIISLLRCWNGKHKLYKYISGGGTIPLDLKHEIRCNECGLQERDYEYYTEETAKLRLELNKK